MPSLNPRQIERIRQTYKGGELTCSQLLEIIQHRVAPGAERAARELARRMCRHEHFNRAAHTRGSEDGTMHHTVYINNRGHHLRLDGSGVVFQITDDNRLDLGLVAPWVAPGD